MRRGGPQINGICRMPLPDFPPLIAGVNPGYLLRMTPIRSDDAPSSGSRLWTALMLLWLAGIGLRLTLLAVPPVIPLIHRDLDLSETAIGTLGTLPSLLLAAGAVPGSLL